MPLRKRWLRPLKRRRPKTAWIIPLVLGALTAAIYFRPLVYKKPKPNTKPLNLETWSRFSEMKRLGMLLKGFAISSMADLLCTDIEHIDIENLPIQHYLGITYEKDEAGALQTRYGTAKSSFMAFNPTIDTLPRVDLILCWDYLCTLSAQEIQATLLQFKKSGATFLLMRHYPEVQKNEEKQPGIFQTINWKIPPYNFPEPIIHIMEIGKNGMESLALWNLENLP